MTKLHIKESDREIMSKAIESNLAVLLVGDTGCGKCLGRGTPVLMYDGTVRKVEDIKVGELIMGDDSTPRTIISLARGRENMYKVIPTKGDFYVVNESHILSLKKSGGKNNTPKNVVYSYKKISEIKKMNIKDVKKEIFNNYEKIFW